MYLVPEADLPCRLQLRRRLAGLHRLHQLPGEGFCLCSLLRAEGTDCFKVEESVGLAAPAGSFLQGDPGDHTVDRSQGAGEPGPRT